MDFDRIEPPEDPTRELRSLIRTLENQHRENMRPYYEMLARYEAMMTPRAVVFKHDLFPEQVTEIRTIASK
jgi:hypothetical protein